MAESASAKIQQEANASSSVNIDIPEKKERPCIYKVPDPLRKLDEEVYSPQVISIGPFHHGNEKLQIMEKYKVKYLIAFIERTEIKIEDLRHVVRAFEESIRQCYEGTICLSSDEFATMILTDAGFIIEVFLRNTFTQWNSEDRIVLKPWLATKMQLDLILLENQLPFFIIDKLFDIAFASSPGFPSFVALTFEYFRSYNKQKMSLDPQLEILHFSDLLRNFYLPPRRRLPNRKLKTVERMYCATQLDGVGLKFEVDLSSNCLLDIDLHLDYKKRVLKIPCFTLDNGTELYVRNLLALEHCHYPMEAYVTDYFILLDFLIKTEKDVDLLRQQRIAVGGLDNKQVTNFINNLGTSMIYSTMSSNYYDICIKLKNFYEYPGWLENIRRNYFRTVVRKALSIVTILTLIQTGCSLFSAIKGR